MIGNKNVQKGPPQKTTPLATKPTNIPINTTAKSIKPAATSTSTAKSILTSITCSKL